jgi:hypothetical protein
VLALLAGEGDLRTDVGGGHVSCLLLVLIGPLDAVRMVCGRPGGRPVRSGGRT